MAARCGRLPPCLPGLCPPGSCTGWRHRGKTLSALHVQPDQLERREHGWRRLLRALVEPRPGVFYGAAARGGTNGNGVVFRYSLSNPGAVEVVHDFSALNSAGQNSDGASPGGRLALGPHGTLYSNTEAGGANGNGVIYSVREDGHFEVLHTFSATNATTGANDDGAFPDEGLIAGREQAHRNSHLRRQRQPRRLQQQRRYALRVDIGRLLALK